jgi:hypothetical protein
LAWRFSLDLQLLDTKIKNAAMHNMQPNNSAAKNLSLGWLFDVNVISANIGYFK